MKLAVIFPDIGYNTDQPLLYYSKKVLQHHGFEVTDFPFDGQVAVDYKEMLKDNPDATSARFKEEIFRIVAEAHKNGAPKMKAVDWAKCENIIFVSKGVGSVIASLFANKMGLMPVHVMYAPLEPTFQFLTKEEGIIFSGMDDDFINFERLKAHSRKTNMAVYRFDDCNHRLETGEFDTDLRNLTRICRLVDIYLQHAHRTIYDFSVRNLDDDTEPLSKFSGKVALIVNTATGCGFTPQYEKLEEIFEKYKHEGFTILDFPCNQFLNQAPGTSREIHSFCRARYKTEFPQFMKINVNGDEEEPLYTYLKSKRGFQGFDMTTLDGQYLDKKVREEFPDYESTSDIKWNFTKFLVDKKGRVVERYEPTTDFNIITSDIEKLLAST